MQYRKANECHLRGLADSVRWLLESYDVSEVTAVTPREHWLPFDRAVSDLRIALRLLEYEG